MALWAEPVIADCVADIYAGHGLSEPLTALLAVHHRRLWRALLLDQKNQAERVWIDLARDLTRAGLDHRVTEDVDIAVQDELMDILFSRYRTSRDKARAFSRVLLSAAAQTAAVRPLQA